MTLITSAGRLRTLLVAAAIAAFGLPCMPPLASEALSVRFQHLNRADGLSQSFVYTIVQDDTGYMWFGTQEGLNRFDGFDFSVFAHDPGDPGSLSDETVRAMIKSRDGVLWVGTDAGGLSRYDANRQTFTNYLNDPADARSISDNRVRAIFEDSRGRLWIGTDGSGLELLDRNSGTFTHYPPDPVTTKGPAGAKVWSIHEDRYGDLWVATESGVSVLAADTEIFRHFRHDPEDPKSLSDNHVRVVFEDSAGTLWLGTDAGGLNRFRRDTGTFERFTNDPGDPTSISANRVQALYEDQSGVLWVGTVDGLNAFNHDSGTFDRYGNDPANPYSLPQTSVLSIFQDRGGVLWVGTYDGVSRWNPSTRAMLHYSSASSARAKLSSDTVTAFAEDRDGSIWVATYGGGLNRLDRNSGQFVALAAVPGEPHSLPSDRVMAVLADHRGDIWAGTRASGLSRYDIDRRTFTHFRHDAAEPTSLGADGVTYLLEDRNNVLWVATFGGGVSRLDRQSGGFTQFRHDPADATSLSNDRVLTLFEDADGILWAGTYGGGLNRFDPATGSFRHFRADSTRADALAGDDIYMIQEGTNGDLWVGVKDGGLNRWRREDRDAGIERWQRFGELDGLPSATIYGGVWDDRGHLWLSTARGLSALDTQTLEFRNFDESHGLQGLEFNLSAAFRASDGQLFFGGLNGFNAFYPDRLSANVTPPPVVITGVSALNTPIDMSFADSDDGRLLLEHTHYVIGFEFAALDFAAPAENRFQYMLEGLDRDWVDAGTIRHVSYTNLPPGDYRFRVRAANYDGVWSEQDAVVELSMSPAPWRSWWAYLLYAAALAALAFAALRAHAARNQRLIEAQHATELKVLKARLTDAQRIARMGNWEWDAATNSLWFSDEIYRLLEIERGMLGATYEAFLQHVHEQDRFAVDRAVQYVLDKLSPREVDYRIVLPDGSARFVQGRAEPVFDAGRALVGMAGTVLDITDRKQSEAIIRKRADFQSMLARLSSDLVRVEPDEAEDQLRASIDMIGSRYGMDGIDVRWKSGGGDILESLCHWARDGSVTLRPKHRRKLTAWIDQASRRGDPVVVDDFAKAGDAELRGLPSLPDALPRSLLLIPMFGTNEVIGTVVFSTVAEPREWSAGVVAELKLVVETLAGAITRTRAAAEIQRLKQLLEEENLYLRKEVRLAHRFDGIVGEDRGLRSCLQAVEKVAPTDIPVVVLGETGTGKELIAREIHRLSKRCDRPMISVNCPALPSNLIESELFGHEKGAFTGAHGQRRGRFELADGGTLFLDEIGELPLELQSKLLRVLQTGEFERLGGTKTLQTDVRLIAATNRNLQAAIDAGDFRADLYYRISSFPIRLPPLRDRKEDIPLLAEHFVHKHGQRLGKKVRAISARMVKDLSSYPWPGNVRELEGIIERALISAEDSEVLELPGPLRLIATLHQSRSDFMLEEAAELSSIERAHIVNVLESTNWQISGSDGAASVLGIPSSTLRSKMKRLGIERGTS